MKNNIVCKFGGTSLANAQNIEKVKNIVLSGQKKFVIVSAPGKRNKADTKITDLLINSFNLSKENKDFTSEFNLLKQRFEEIKNYFNLNINLTPYYNELHKQISKHTDYDFVVSRGEFFSALLIAKVLNYEFLDASSFITFNNNGQVELTVTKQKFLSLINKKKNYVIPGFYGVKVNGKIKTFSRGGSDITGAIVACISKIKTYENWTDVDGFLVADPRVCDSPEIIHELSYHELRELSYMGANVLHPDCVRFLRENDIILNLRNTFNPTCKGSFIMPDRVNINHKNLTGIAGQKGFTIIHIEKFAINESLGIIEIIANIFKKYNISIEHIPTGIDSVSVIFKSVYLNSETKNKLTEEITAQIKPDNLKIVEDVALISIVGTKLKNSLETEKKVFDSVFKANVNLITLNKGASGLSIIFAIYEKDFEVTVKTLYKLLF